MRHDIALLLLLLVLPPSSVWSAKPKATGTAHKGIRTSVRSAKPKATGTAQKGICGYFAPVVKTQQNADDDHDYGI